MTRMLPDVKFNDNGYYEYVLAYVYNILATSIDVTAILRGIRELR